MSFGKFGTYYVETLGCQMNAHDSERIAGVLESMGLKPTTKELAIKGQTDVFAINTCAVRENASNKLYGHISQLSKFKRTNPDFKIVVGGCLAQKDRDDMIKRAPYVDVVFGTYNIQGLPELLKKVEIEKSPQVGILPRLIQFPSSLEAVRQSKTSAWVSISMGCNNRCSFCIVPSLRGKERDRRPGEILDEVSELVDSGVKEITLLGQNVNSYGSEFADRGAFAKLLRAMGEFEDRGLKRVRFTSPHPAAFTDDVIFAMRDTNNVMPSLHMPLQSGSNKVLGQMRRSYSAEKFLERVGRVREILDNPGITTDIIVGFPGETDENFNETLEVVKKAQFSSAYTFQYSIRPGTQAGEREDQIPKEVVQERFERLLELQNSITHSLQKEMVGKTIEVMVSDSDHRNDESQNRVSAYSKRGHLVHIEGGAGNETGLLPGDFKQVKITYAAPFHLIGSLVD